MFRRENLSRRKIDVSQLRTLYTVKHLTLAQIAKMFDVSRSAVWKQLQRLRIPGHASERVKYRCDWCKQDAESHRSRWRKSRKHYCSNACYWSSLENPAFVEWRQGKRIARRVAAFHFNLEEKHVVHHWDSNQRNNRVDNLAVFATASEHHSFERGGDALPIWDGRTVTKGKHIPKALVLNNIPLQS